MPLQIKSIKNKLILSIALIHAVLMTLFIFDLVQRQMTFLEKESRVTAIGIAKTLATNSVPWMLSNDLAGLAEITDAQAQQANINFVMLINTEGKILAYHNNRSPQHHETSIGRFLELPKHDPFNMKKSVHTYFDDDNAVDVAIPIWKEDTQLGWARVQLSRLNTTNSIEFITREGLFYALIAILSGTVMAWLMGHNLTRRIYRLIETTKRIREGERNLPINTQGNDELSVLAKNFSSMLQQLEKNENALFEEKERAEITLKSIGDAVVVIDENGNIGYMNPAAEQITAWECEDALNKPITEVMQLFNESTKKPVTNPALRALEYNKVVGISKETILINRLGDTISLVDSAAPIIDRNSHIIGAIMVFHDATEERSLQQRLSWQANHDTLTELYNRSAFESELERLIQLSASDKHSKQSLLYLDLDQFKIINDTVGHTAGDLLLKQLAMILEQTIQSRGFLSRLGGDEFAVLMSDCDTDSAVHLAEEIRRSIANHRLFWEGKSFQVGCSIGIAAIHGNLSKTTILSRADIACYLAKDKGRNRIEVYQENDNSLAQDQHIIDWVNRIKHGLDTQQFLLYAQKITNLQSPEQYGESHYEILVRMRDEDGQIITPNHFLPAAERFDLMSQLDLYIAEKAIQWLKRYSAKIELLNINISGQSLGQQSFTDELLALLESNIGNNHKICFEITETVAISQMNNTIEFLNTVKEFGCKLALDDFGSGFASFTWLKNLPIDFVKIDGDFIRDVLNDPVDAAMVRTIRDISEIMQIQSVAEFVENQEICDWLRETGIHYAQGYYFDKPKPIEQVFA
ncbi:EAL domain-containing protein [Thiomicrorhabdus xiamenensis]|uniref:EAL domain-containing protein n=1 Tax=Thiomicrorhabdus xiamenensis TaxID=2739063 RepID=A0A7D4NQ41_9GAMM|nr:EAL domain-containing protein [Thiomicrorhabdus xiamenensis]QKI88517.1 EAL domain-containing protein [Thiomicrorhabdus xiamenensis]